MMVRAGDPGCHGDASMSGVWLVAKRNEWLWPWKQLVSGNKGVFSGHGSVVREVLE
jgi:hypothetical protein